MKAGLGLALAVVATMTLLLVSGGNAFGLNAPSSQLKHNFHVTSSGFLGEDFDVTGTLHVLTRANAGDTTTFDVHTSLSTTTAVGLETGSLYRVVGAEQWLNLPPPDIGDAELMFVGLMALARSAQEDAQTARQMRMLIRMHFTSSFDLLSVDVLAPCSVECD